MRATFILLFSLIMLTSVATAHAARDFSGLWFDPTHDGEGFVVEVISEDLAVVYWFTYDGEGKQRWFIGIGSIQGDSLTVDSLLMPVGARFGDEFDPDDVERQTIGSLNLMFAADSATAQYSVDSVAGSQDLIRLASPRSLAAVPGLADCVTGSWFDPSHDGEGYIVHMLDDNRAVILWFTFTPDGQQAWFLSETAVIQGDAISASMLETAGGRFGDDFDPDEVEFSTWGELDLSLGSCRQGRSDYDSLKPEYGGGELTGLTKLTSLLRPTGQADSEAIKTGLRQILNEQSTQQANTGISVAVVFSDGTAWTGSAGWDDPRVSKVLQPAQTLGFASITKTYVAALIMQLVDEGVLTLNDTVATWLPPQTNITPTANLVHMLNHTSGIADYANDSPLIGVIRSNPNLPWEPEDLIGIFVRPAYYAPGTSSGYSNTNYLLLGQILETATGQDISTLLQQRIFDRNALGATYLGGHEPDAENIPITWVDLDGNGVLDDFSAFYTSPSHHSARWTAGGMLSNVEDIARWAHVLFKGNVVSQESVSRMRQFQSIIGTGPVWTGYGLGIQQYLASGMELWGHSGSISGSNSLMVYSPLLDISIALVDTDNRANHISTVRAILPFLEANLNQSP